MKTLKLFFAFLIILSFNKTQAQSSFKQEKHRFYNIVSGYSLIPATIKLNDRLTANNFPNLVSPHYIFGLDYGGVTKRGIVESEISVTGGFVGKGLSYSLLRTENISLTYGRDILPKAERTYFYPFLGYNLHSYVLLGKSSDKETLDGSKIDFDIITGLGLKCFFKRDLIGAFSNIALNAGISIPTITGKWTQTGSQYLVGIYRLQSVFDFTASLGF
ncbi:MAG TPA: hypothetical protein VIJ95_11355 [Hanamia sp.]